MSARWGLVLFAVLGVVVSVLLARLWRYIPDEVVPVGRRRGVERRANLRHSVFTVIALLAVMAFLLALQVSIVCEPKRYFSEHQWKDWNRAINKGDPHPVLAVVGSCVMLLWPRGGDDWPDGSRE